MRVARVASLGLASTIAAWAGSSMPAGGETAGQPRATIAPASSGAPEASSSTPVSAGSEGGGEIGVFSASSPWNSPVSDNPALDPNSSELVSRLAGDGGMFAMAHEYADPIVTADGTPPQNVSVENHWAHYYEGPVPFPANSSGSVGSDGALIVLDPAGGYEYEFWRVRHESSGWVAAYADRVPLNSDGVPGYGATGSDIPLLDGLIRGSEVRAGRIDHALTVATNDTASTFRWPAAKSDGHNAYPPGIPEGARVQLDPSVNCAAIGGSVIETEICRALEEYGAFVKDTTSPALSLGFQDEGTVGPGNPYYDAGLTADELKMTHIPLSRLRVLASAAGIEVPLPIEELPSPEPPPTAAVPHTPSGCAITEHREGTTAWLTLGCTADPSEDNVSSYELYRAGGNRTQLSGGAETGFGPGAPWTTAPTPAFFNRLYVSAGEDECYSVAARNSAGVSPRSPWECVTAAVEEPPSHEPPPTAAVPHTPSGCAITEHREGTTAWLTLGCTADPSEDNVSSYELYRAGPNRTQLSGGAETGFGPGAPWTTAPTPAFFNRLYVSAGEAECYSVAARNSAGVSPRSPWECVTP